MIPELVVPAGNLSKLRTAVAYGADAVYVGAAGFSMRPDEASFTSDDLKNAVGYAHKHDTKLFVAVNSMMFDDDIGSLREWLGQTHDLPFDAFIVSDAGALDLAKAERPDVRIHISTQMNTANSGSAAFWKRMGAERVVLSRECSLQQTKQIVRDGGVEVEVFIHGAMCVAVSGRCLLSAHLCGHSGSRGDCKHSCRWEWQLVEQKRPGATISAFETGRETIFLGSTDLCMIGHLPELIETGAHALKIEGRMKSEHYIAAVTRVYRAALDRYASSVDEYKVDPTWMDELKAVSHRPHSTGFAFGYPSSNPESLQTHNWPVSTHDIVGVLLASSTDRHDVAVKNPFLLNETLEWIGPGMAGGMVTVSEIKNEQRGSLASAHCGTTVNVVFEGAPELPESTIFRRKKKSQEDKV